MTTARAVSAEPEPLLLGQPSEAALTDHLLAPLWSRSWVWYPLFAVTGLGSLVFFAAIAYTFATGIGAWGNNIPVAWAFAIINFVWWIGIGHAGTFISAFLLLLQQPWRASINRFAEAMTLFAIVNAGIMPILHLGRPWFFYWLVPYPATMGVWPQFRSSLPADVAAISTYATISLLFWYLGLIPDLAAARDRAPTLRRRRAYGVFALGWRGSAHDWRRYRLLYGVMAGLATPLVISVHSIVSLDFSISQLPGWHSLIFPPYFVVGALLSGFAMVLTLVVPVRSAFRLHDVITAKHLDSLAKVTLTMSLLLFYSYSCEHFIAWYSGSQYERFLAFTQRPFGPYGWVFWLTLFCVVAVPQVYWSGAMRRSPLVLFLTSLLIQVGMWSERFAIVVSSLNRDFLPSSWHFYSPSWVDWSLLSGSIAFFCFNFLLFLRFVPFVAIHEIKELRRAQIAGEAS